MKIKQKKTVTKRMSKIMPDSRPTNYAHLYENQGWVNVLKFDVRIDELEVESFVKKEFSH